jgi:uncharacterized membrane protein YfcA
MTDIILGFCIAVAIGLTGVGGGTLTTPLLILVVRLPPAVAVGTALVYAATMQFTVTPIYLFKKKVNFRACGWMCLGGIPGVVIGGLTLNRLAKTLNQHTLFIVLGCVIFSAALANMYRLVNLRGKKGTGDHPQWLAPLMLPVGAEVGFSSAGAGALGSLALLGLTRLEGTQVVATDLAFAMVLSIVGSGIQVFHGNYDGGVLVKLLIGGVVGVLTGSWLATRIPSIPMKWGLAAWLAGLGANLFIRGLMAS